MSNEEFFYQHDGYGDFEASIPSVTIDLPPGENISVNGPRQTPFIISISNKVERNPKRDARMLFSTLSSSLEEQTLYYLAEYLYSEFVFPLLQEQAIVGAVKNSRKRSSKTTTNDNQAE